MSGLQDSGARSGFEVGGALREADPDKPFVEGISPYAIERLGMHMTRADIKYKAAGGYRNWEKGIPVLRTLGAIFRHYCQYLRRDDSEDHLAAIMWNAMTLIHYEEVGAWENGVQVATFEQLDDRPRWRRREKIAA